MYGIYILSYPYKYNKKMFLYTKKNEYRHYRVTECNTHKYIYTYVENIYIKYIQYMICFNIDTKLRVFLLILFRYIYTIKIGDFLVEGHIIYKSNSMCQFKAHK